MEQNTLFNTEVSRRYSKALLSISSNDNSEQEIYNEVSNLLELFESNDLFIKLFLSPLLSSKSQLKLVSNLFSNTDKKKIKVSKNVLAFLKVLARNVSKFGNSPAYREKEYGIWQTWTWSEANEEIMNLAKGLIKLGVKGRVEV